MCSKTKKERALHTIRRWAGSKIRENIICIQSSEKSLQKKDSFMFFKQNKWTQGYYLTEMSLEGTSANNLTSIDAKV